MSNYYCPAVFSMLRKAIGLGNKIPKGHYDLYKNVNVPIGYQCSETPFGYICANVIVTASNPHRGHRVFIVCPHCHNAISAGRLGQHWKYKHPSIYYPGQIKKWSEL